MKNFEGANGNSGNENGPKPNILGLFAKHFSKYMRDTEIGASKRAWANFIEEHGATKVNAGLEAMYASESVDPTIVIGLTHTDTDLAEVMWLRSAEQADLNVERFDTIVRLSKPEDDQNVA